MGKAKQSKGRKRQLPEKNTTGKPRPAPPDVRARQDDDYTVEEFMRALDKGTRRSGRS